MQEPCEKSNQVEDRDSEKTLDHQTSKQDNVNDHMDDRSKGCSTVEKFETQYPNLSGKTETIASAKHGLQKSLEISESPFNTTRHEMGDIADAIVEQASDECETYTLADKINIFEIIQEDFMEETNEGETKDELLGRKDADLNAIQTLASQSISSMEKNNSDPVIISTLNEDTGCEYREANEDGTRKDAIIRSNKTIDDADGTEVQHIIRDSDKAGVRQERMVINNYISIKRLKRKHIRLINTIQKKDSTTTSNSLQPVFHNGKILVTKKSHAFNGKFDGTMKRKLRTR